MNTRAPVHIDSSLTRSLLLSLSHSLRRYIQSCHIGNKAGSVAIGDALAPGEAGFVRRDRIAHRIGVQSAAGAQAGEGPPLLCRIAGGGRYRHQSAPLQPGQVPHSLHCVAVGSVVHLHQELRQGHFGPHA